jgi:predicted nucleic acid binding AN1-type Zn finger protein
MKIKKNTFCTLVLVLFSHQLQTVGNWKSKKSKNRLPLMFNKKQTRKSGTLEALQ